MLARSECDKRFSAIPRKDREDNGGNSMERKTSALKAIKAYFGYNSRPVEMSEIKALTKEDRAELGNAILAAHTDDELESMLAG